jgi:hypothetical protein
MEVVDNSSMVLSAISDLVAVHKAYNVNLILQADKQIKMATSSLGGNLLRLRISKRKPSASLISILIFE